MFDQDVIEQHAAECEGGSGSEGESTASLFPCDQDKSARVATLRSRYTDVH